MCFFKDLLCLPASQSYRKRVKQRKSFSSPASLPKWPLQPVLGWPEARSFLVVSHEGAGAQGLGEFSVVLPRALAELEVEELGLELALIWDASTIDKGLTYLLPCQPGNVIFNTNNLS